MNTLVCTVYNGYNFRALREISFLTSQLNAKPTPNKLDDLLHEVLPLVETHNESESRPIRAELKADRLVISNIHTIAGEPAKPLLEVHEVG